MKTRHTIAYLLLVGLPAGALLAVLAAGSGLSGPVVLTTAPAAAGTSTLAWSTGLLIAQVAVILLAARLVGRLFRSLGQPQVIGEMAAGIMLGPSLLGWLAPGASQALFAPGSLGGLGALSEVGLVLFMFVVGLDLDTKALRTHGRAALVCSHASIVVPFVLGSALALHLYADLAPPTAPFVGFALFLGAAMSITAFPVLARILADEGLSRTRLGTIAIAAAAIGDVTAWCVLAGIVVVVRAGSGTSGLWTAIGGSLAFTFVMWFVIRPALRLLERRFAASGHLSTDSLAVMLLVALGSAWVTDAIGVHALFGAFLAGAVMPRSPLLTAAVRERIESVTVVLLLPIFFAVTGLRSSLDLLVDPALLVDLGLVFAVAVIGKLGGAGIAARSTGMPWRAALAFGALMNTRGLMELVILNIGLDIGAISPPLFSMMVLMAIVTTMMTTPLLRMLKPPEAGS
jgi:Kef-type K+ transport system membrane component KefB